MPAMSEIRDDPREVLVLLNSLGFVGITATQLKAFMKDLKIYRKIKERERQQRKEEIKTKIVGKQQALIKEAHGHRDTDYLNNSVHSEPSNFFNESLVKVRIRCIPTEGDVQNKKYSRATVLKSNEKLSAKEYAEDITQITDSNRIYCQQNHFNTTSYPVIKKCSKSENKQNGSKCLIKNNHLIEGGCKYNVRVEEPVTLVHEHSVGEAILSNRTSRSESKSIGSDPIGNVRVRSTLSAGSSTNSRHKSFIRPWRLQPETQKSVTNKKCDPVALYQKYQQEWKKISFPGEAKHSKVRWAVREKMLGIDPRPVPLSRKSVSMPILKKK